MRSSHSLPLLVLLVLAACGPVAEPLTPPPPIAPEPAQVAPPSLAIADDPTGAERIAADIRYLASPELAGRGTGEEGARLAADYVVRRFEELSLAPAGQTDEHAPASYRQAFQARVGAKVGTPVLSFARGRKVTPAPAARMITADGSASGEAKGKAVLVGFGITAPAAGWDDYAGADVEGKIAIVLDGAPTKGPKAEALRDFGRVRYKIRTAREHHAAGVIVVQTSAAPLPEAPTDPSSMGLPAVVLAADAATLLFKTEGLDTGKLAAAEKPGKARPLGFDALTIKTEITPLEATAWNIVGLLPARAGSPHASEIVVVGAHYDHLGHGGTPASRAPGVHAIHPGADDNASGTALVLEVARRFAGLPGKSDRALLFMAFGAEELGVLGSRHWIEHPTVPLDHVVAMVNADMVGRLRDNHLNVDGVGTAAGWRPLIDEATKGTGFDLAFGAEGFGASDHASFTAARVPVAFLFTGAHADYHMPSDTADKIDAAGEQRIATVAARLALGAAQAKERLVFVDAPADPHSGTRGGFKVSLGTIPDYGYGGKGVRLDGVRPDAPAARAGIQAGDVIVQVGGHEITNIHDYMFALGDLEPGREVVIEVERGGRRIPLKVVPAPGR